MMLGYDEHVPGILIPPFRSHRSYRIVIIKYNILLFVVLALNPINKIAKRTDIIGWLMVEHKSILTDKKTSVTMSFVMLTLGTPGRTRTADPLFRRQML